MRLAFRILTLATATGALLLIGGPVSAGGGGGGCHQGVTTGEGGPDGATVEMIDACFTPTTLRVDPGTEITFVNRDPMTHNVVANDWGYFDKLNQGDGFTVTFDENGVYAYACNIHPGMTGSIVVGGGTGAGSGTSVPVAPLETPDPVVVTRTVAAEGTSADWITAGAIGLLLGAAGGIGLSRIRRRAIVPA
jgi:plastocyanin